MSNEKNLPDKLYAEESKLTEGFIYSDHVVYPGDCFIEYTRTDLLAEQDKQILDALETNLLWAEVEQDRDQIEAAIKILQERVAKSQQ